MIVKDKDSTRTWTREEGKGCINKEWCNANRTHRQDVSCCSRFRGDEVGPKPVVTSNTYTHPTGHTALSTSYQNATA